MITIATDDVRAIERAVGACRQGWRYLRRRPRLRHLVLAVLQVALLVFGWGDLVAGVRTILGWGLR